MAVTRRPSDAFDYVKNLVKRMPVESIQGDMLNIPHQIMWMAAPWRWTTGAFVVGTLTTSQQDYVPGSPPSDMLYGIHAYISDGSKDPRHLEVVSALPTDVKVVGNPSEISNIPGGNNWRLFPKPGTVSGTPTITMVYKLVAPVIDVQTMHTAGVQLFPDEWFWVYQSGVLWQAYQYADDDRAGAWELTSDGKFKVSGMAAQFLSNVNWMVAREKLPLSPTAEYRTVPDPRVVAK